LQILFERFDGIHARAMLPNPASLENTGFTN